MNRFVETHPISVTVDDKYPGGDKKYIRIDLIQHESICVSPRGADRIIKMLEQAKAVYKRKHGHG